MCVTEVIAGWRVNEADFESVRDELHLTNQQVTIRSAALDCGRVLLAPQWRANVSMQWP
jgi:hypothetical protein